MSATTSNIITPIAAAKRCRAFVQRAADRRAPRAFHRQTFYAPE